MSRAKEQLTRLIQGQPEDSSREEIVRELAFYVMVERGLADSDAKRTISNELSSLLMLIFHWNAKYVSGPSILGDVSLECRPCLPMTQI